MTSPPPDGPSQDGPPKADPSQPADGFAALVNYRIVRWEAGAAEITVALDARHANRSGFMHGGVLTTVIDAACGLVGVHSEAGEPLRRAATLALTTQFIAAAQAGDTIFARASLKGGGRSVFFATCEVFDQSERLIGRGDGTFRIINLDKARP